MNGSDDKRRAEVEESLAAEDLDPSDLALLNSIRSYYDEHDPVPEGLVERIEFEITLDALRTEVATLTRLDMAAAGTRGAATETVRTITFSSQSLTTMVSLTPLEDGTVRVDGWAAPGAGIRVDVLLPDGPRSTHADEDGRFVFERVPSGLAKFALYLPHDAEFFTVLSPAIEL
ncbi:MAG TPA: hypothetical protein VFB83_07390 [Propionibacteriaceae bacterium]|jgi:hypothetical protein|nr:hypothetical protein [Propionibacteriaceae bacterium]